MSDENLAILTLANAGAYDHALAEYARLNLDEIDDDEDIMALKGRLLKDIYRERTGPEAIDLARRSADAYETAFAATGGFYSAINSATMSLLAKADDDAVRTKARRVLDMISDFDAVDAQSKYFVEATHAEAHLLLDQKKSAARSMDTAREHDPLNYTAHASTLSQFQLIASHRGETLDWLEKLRPPRSMHFCGHMFTSDAPVDALRAQIVNALQTHDIGFGYGSLAAGSDILIAETLLEEGGELHVVLPVPPERFASVSVSPFGQTWEARFQHCLANATTLTIIEPHSKWPDAQADMRAAIAAMGSAIRCGWRLQTGAEQLLLWDGQADDSATALNAALWQRSGRADHRIPLARMSSTNRTTSTQFRHTLAFKIMTTTGVPLDVLRFEEVEAYLATFWDQNPRTGRCLILARLSDAPSLTAPPLASARILDTAPSGGVYLDRLTADWISLLYADRFVTSDVSALFSSETVFSVSKTVLKSPFT